MNVEDIRDFALRLEDVEESTPFGKDTLVFKTKNKIFLILPLDTTDIRFNVKCDPSLAIELREQYPENILPGYHMNKKHWNTIVVGSPLKNIQILEFIRESYHLVYGKKKVVHLR